MLDGWILAATPWIAMAAGVALRMRGNVTLDQYALNGSAGGAAPGDARAGADRAPAVSIILPARNEARHIAECIAAIRASHWTDFELIVVDDHSTDGTGELARRAAAGDARIRIIDAPDLPAGWFGKQWACHSAVQHARGNLLVFTDADTRHGPELLARSLTAMRERRADLLSVIGTQMLESFWERLLMPQVFVLLLSRYGNTEVMSRSTNPRSKIANGQYFMLTRAMYDRVGGHAAVRDHVAEDLRIAQEACRRGASVQIVDGREHLHVRMYEGLGEFMRGWGKNVYAGGRDTFPEGRIVRALVRALYPLPAMWNIVPFVLGLVAAFGALPQQVLWWAGLCYAASAVLWMATSIESRVAPWYGLLHPLASAMLTVLFTRAAVRGDRVQWKGREYRSASAQLT